MKLLNWILNQKWAVKPTELRMAAAIVKAWTEGREDQLDPAAALRLRELRAGGRYGGGYGGGGRYVMEDDRGRDYREPFTMHGRVAVVPVCGLIARHAGMVNGLSQPEGIAVEDLVRNLQSAARRSQRLLLDVDSPGGTLAGMSELAACIDGLRAGGVRVVALARDQMCSGAYWMSCRCDDIFAVGTAEVGSIGVYQCVTDFSRQLDEAGITVHLLASGVHKGAGAEGTELNEVQRDGLLECVMDAAALFTRTVAQGRGLDQEEAATVSTGMAWMAEQALALKLIDGIVSGRDELIEQMNGMED